MSKPSLARGTRDFLPEEMLKRKYIFGIIEKVFVRYGFQCIETPAVEQMATLTGKYGDEGDRLVFKILNSGDFLTATSDADIALAREKSSKTLVPLICEKALRYDLTVPLARFVVMHQNSLSFPFKRYQIQPVWRADRPQKGRYREFYQCDADIIGSGSLFNEAELLGVYTDVFLELGFTNFFIKINNRKLLHGIAEIMGNNSQTLTIVLDKLDKIGKTGVSNELLERGFEQAKIDILFNIIEQTGGFEEKLQAIKSIFEAHNVDIKGVTELQTIYDHAKNYANVLAHLQLDLSLARGLDYYTGAIFEVTTPDVAMGSLGGGGRYDHLTEIFGLKNTTGVGISFGAERILDVLNELNLLQNLNAHTTKVLLATTNDESFGRGIAELQYLRTKNINAELYPEPTKLKKQLNYANDKKIAYVVIIGEDELKTGILTLKNMQDGEQLQLPMTQIAEILK